MDEVANPAAEEGPAADAATGGSDEGDEPSMMAVAMPAQLRVSGAIFSACGGAGGLAYGAIIGLLIFFGTLVLVFEDGASPLSRIGNALLAAARAILPYFLLSLARVTRPDGQLAALSADSSFIAATAASRLRAWQVPMAGWTVFWLLVSTNLIVREVLPVVAAGSKTAGADATLHGEMPVWALLGLALMMQFLLTNLASWWLSLKVASALVSARVAAADRLIRDTHATSPEWDQRVVPACLALMQKTLPALSSGFGDAVLSLFGFGWLAALGFFSMFLDSESVPTAVLCFIFAMLPLGISLDVAGASSDCDSLPARLNDKRVAAVGTADCDAVDGKLQVLERALTFANRKQGIGFVVPGGKVLDKRTLYMIFMSLTGGERIRIPIPFAG